MPAAQIRSSEERISLLLEVCPPRDGWTRNRLRSQGSGTFMSAGAEVLTSLSGARIICRAEMLLHLRVRSLASFLRAAPNFSSSYESRADLSAAG